MMLGIENLVPQLSAILLTYAVYSTAASLVLLVVVRPRWIGTPEARLICLRVGLLAPILLALLSPWFALSWSPVIMLAIDGEPRPRSPVENPREVATSRRGDDERRASERKLASPTWAAGELDSSAPRRGEGGSVRTVALDFGRWPNRIAVVAVGGWLTLALLGLVWILVCLHGLGKLVATGRPVRGAELIQEFRCLKQRAGCTRSVALLASDRVDSPLVFGIRRDCVMVLPEWFGALSMSSQRAILAHELAHVVRRDPLWNVITQLTLRILWFQPLNHLLARRLRTETEFLADRFAATLLANPMELAWSLVDAAERLLKTRGRRRATPLLAASISAFDSGLEQRVAAMLAPHYLRPDSRMSRLRNELMLFVGCVVLILAVPRFQAPRTELFLDDREKPMMHKWIAQSGLIAGLLLNPWHPAIPTVSAAEEQETAERPTADVAAVPEELKQFNGMLIGRLVDRDIERGVFTVKVDYVARVWENSRARNPRAAVGKTLRVDGVSGKWIDQLLLVRPGETLEFEAQHRGGDTLTFPGEWLKKTAPFKAEEHPVPPEGFRGFAGVITGKVERKNLESHDLIVRVDAVEKTFDGSRAENAETVLGKPIVLAGFWGKMREPLEKLEVGDSIRAGVLHRVPKSDHFTVAEFVEEVAKTERREPAKRDSAGRSSPDAKDSVGAFPAGMRGFRGILRGQLVSRDVEKGELVFRAERVTRTWQENKATDTESCRGREFVVKRITGKWLDVLVTLKPGDAIEVEAFHNGGQHLDFVSEWLKKVE